MAMTVWRFPLSFREDPKSKGQPIARTVMKMPKGAEALTLQMQVGGPSLWALVDSDAPTEEREFVAVGTGYDVPDDAGSYVGTWQAQDGVFVFHLFEVA